MQLRETPIPNNRLVFQSPTDFYNTYSALSKFQTEDELRYWAQSKTHTTLLDSLDSIICNYSGTLRTILNKDSEFELGDSIVIFLNGDLYGYSKQEANISIQKNPEKFKKAGSVVVSIVQSQNSKNDVAPGGVDATWQNQFYIHSYQPCGGTLQTGLNSLRKFVSELYYEQISFFPNPWRANLWLRIKLEERPSSGWRQCYNYRDISYDVAGTAVLYYGGVPDYTTNYEVTGNFLCSTRTSVSGPINVFLAYKYEPSYNVGSFRRVYGSGFIYQHILGEDNYITIPSAYPGGDLWN